MELSYQDKQQLAEDMLIETCGKLDGGRKNILVPECPYCGHDGYKFGIFIGQETKQKKFGSSHCFSCGKSCRTLNETLKLIGHEELIPEETMEMGQVLSSFNLFDDDEIDDELAEVELPEYYKRTYKNRYLKSRGWTVDDMEYFPAGTTRGMNWKFDDYVIFPVIMEQKVVGYVSRHTWSKEEIDDYNIRHKRKIRRYNNSTGEMCNGFGKLLYNYDAIIPTKTDTVVLCEGIFDVVGLVRGMDLYDNTHIVPVATFGKKISEDQMYMLQKKGVRTIVIGYDNDEAASDSIGKVAWDLDPYFEVYAISYPQSVGKDFGDMHWKEMYDLFANHIVKPRQLFFN